MTKLRFAPSPTGYVHPGNIRTALVNWLFCQKNGGTFLLRMDDTDSERSKAEYEAACIEDLQWLGITWDGVEKQSARLERYDLAAEKLKKDGRLYACYETPKELEVQRKQLAARGLPPIYNRDSLKLTDEQKATYEAEGRKPHWRFLLKEEDIEWDDLIRGASHFNPKHISDPVLIRADGVPLYTLASVVDDGEMHITHVVRGEDHVTNTAVQTQIFDALGYTRPQFAHMALLKTKDGELSKRTGGNDIRSLREAGIMPMAVNSLLARIGTSDPVEAFADMQPIIDSFDFSKFSRSPANYDPAELEKLNEKLLHGLPFDAVKDQLDFADEDFWLSIRANLTKLSDAKEWWDILHGEVNAGLDDVDTEFVKATADKLPPEPWDETTYDAWLEKVKSATDRKGKTLFMPLRKALTGLERGPELKKLLPLLGAEKTRKRLSAGASFLS